MPIPTQFFAGSKKINKSTRLKMCRLIRNRLGVRKPLENARNWCTVTEHLVSDKRGAREHRERRCQQMQSTTAETNRLLNSSPGILSGVLHAGTCDRRSHAVRHSLLTPPGLPSGPSQPSDTESPGYLNFTLRVEVRSQRGRPSLRHTPCLPYPGMSLQPLLQPPVPREPVPGWPMPCTSL